MTRAHTSLRYAQSTRCGPRTLSLSSRTGTLMACRPGSTHTTATANQVSASYEGFLRSASNLYNLLSSYSSAPDLRTERLPLTTGPIWAAINLDYPHHSFSHIGLYFGTSLSRRTLKLKTDLCPTPLRGRQRPFAEHGLDQFGFAHPPPHGDPTPSAHVQLSRRPAPPHQVRVGGTTPSRPERGQDVPTRRGQLVPPSRARSGQPRPRTGGFLRSLQDRRDRSVWRPC